MTTEAPLSAAAEPFETPVTLKLSAAGVPFRLAIHGQAALTVQEAAEQRGMRPSQLVKTMVLRLPDDTLAAVLVPGDREVDLKLVRAALGVRRLSWLPREEVLAVTGYPPGAVSPVGIRGVETILADPGIADEEEIAISSGSHGAGIRLASADLLRVIDARLVSISRD